MSNEMKCPFQDRMCPAFNDPPALTCPLAVLSIDTSGGTSTASCVLATGVMFALIEKVISKDCLGKPTMLTIVPSMPVPKVEAKA